MAAIDTLRDALFGNPPTIDYRPSREGVVKSFSEVVESLNAIVGGFAASAVPAVYASLGTLNNNLGFADRTLGLVYNDQSPANNGIYIKNGSIGSGSWTRTGLLGVGPNATENQIRAVVLPLFEDARQEFDGQITTQIAASQVVIDQRIAAGQVLIDNKVATSRADIDARIAPLTEQAEAAAAGADLALAGLEQARDDAREAVLESVRIVESIEEADRLPARPSLIVMPLAGSVYTEDFSGGTIGQPPAGWTSRWTAYRYAIFNDPIEGKVLRCTNLNTADGNTLLTWDAIDGDPNRADIEFAIRARAVSGAFWLRGVARASGATNANGVFLGEGAAAKDNIGAAIITVRQNGASVPTTLFGPDVVTTLGPWYWIRGHAFDRNGFRLKMWRDGQPEPEEWTLVRTTESVALPAGWGFGVVMDSFRRPNSVQDISDVIVATGSKRAPIPGYL